MVNILSLHHILLWTSIATSSLALPYRHLEPRARGSPSPAPASQSSAPASQSSSPAAHHDEHMPAMKELARHVTARVKQVAEGVEKTSVALTLDALNGLGDQLLTAARGAELTVNDLKQHSPQILHACDLVETTQRSLGIPLDPKIAAAIKVVRAAAQVINQIPHLEPIKVPPPTDHLEEVLHGSGGGKGGNAVSAEKPANRKAAKGTQTQGRSR